MSTQGFPLKDAQVHGTLASIAYAGDTLNDDNPTIEALHGAINHQLNSRPHYATGHDWKLVWGPVESRKHDNLLYAAYEPSTGTLALSIRGTTGQTLSRFEDIPRYFSTFPDGDAKVSGPFLAGMTSALGLTDKWHGKTFAGFYADFIKTSTVNTVVVNGHSQGAALVPMMMVALQRGLVGAPKVSQPVKGFAYAPPTSGNQAFADIVNAECDCWFIINPKDVVPLGYNAMMDVVDKGIPEELHGFEWGAVKLLIEGLNAYVDPSEWAQPVQQAHLQGVTLVGEGFFAQIGDQHNHNAYLTKLGVTGTDVGDPSAFPVLDPPVINA